MTSTTMRFTSVLTFVAAVVTGCDPASPDITEALPYLGDSGIGIVFSVPDTVTRAVPFLATFAYRGSSSCTKDIRIEARVDGAVATLDSRVRVVNGVCTADLHGFMASQLLQFNTPGPAEVRLRGIYGDRDTTVVRNIFVR
jgi:hypothetical protein